MKINKKIGILLIWFGFLVLCYWIYAICEFDKILLEFELTKFLLSFFLVFTINLIGIGVLMSGILTYISSLLGFSREIKRDTRQKVYEELKSRGYSDEMIKKMMGIDKPD